MIIIIFTQSYPYDFATEQTFIGREINYLLEKFDRVVLVPKICQGKRLPLPTKVEVDEHYAAFLAANSSPHQFMKQAFQMSRFYREIQKNKTILLYPSKFLKLVLFSARAELTRRWLVDWVREHQINTNDCVLYSYWFNHLAAGLGMVKHEFPDVKVVSRAHGYDIYEEYYYPYYWPYRYATLENINRLFFASDAGKMYFCDHYPDFVSKYETAHLGVNDPGFISQPSEDNVFRIVSCSAIVSVKRIELLLNGLATMAHLRPGQKVEWVHFGDGSDRQALLRKLQQSFPTNITGRFSGYMPNHEIFRYYREHPVDAFVNVSKTEGGAPVAIQEAISCGIPVVATSVGGNPEIATQENGVQLSPDPTPDEIARALFELIDNPAETRNKRKRSREIWKQKYDAHHNFSLFAQSLRAIRDAN
jgi:colanic acid/amylovoran biosynthesis glycosyltransferase